MSTENELPAFPTQTVGGYEEDMTLRDYFAAKYMQGLVSTSLFTDGHLMNHEVAGHAYEMAGAMLKARDRDELAAD